MTVLMKWNLRVPGTWQHVMTALPEVDGPHRFRAAGYEMLTDSPILAGNPTLHEFKVAGKSHILVNQAERPEWDGTRAASDVQRIVEEYARVWGTLPYNRYLLSEPDHRRRWRHGAY